MAVLVLDCALLAACKHCLNCACDARHDHSTLQLRTVSALSTDKVV